METVKPFVKWAGGKGSLLPQLTNFYPLELRNGIIDRYVEPFVGGGAVLIDILQKYVCLFTKKMCYYLLDLPFIGIFALHK